MITIRSPLRISFVGGGSDLPAFCNEEPGFVVSAAIQKYVYVLVALRQSDYIRLSYSKTENVSSYKDLEHDIARETLHMFPAFRQRGIEIVSMADLPSGSGLGSSGAFTVGLLHALHSLSGVYRTPKELFNEASFVEITQCAKPVGYQDQAASAFGGLRSYEFNGSDVYNEELSFGNRINELMDRVLLVNTGLNGPSSVVLGELADLDISKKALIRSLVQSARSFRSHLLSGDIDACAEIVDDGWTIKKSMTPSITNDTIDHLYTFAKEHGAVAGKLCGAGGRGMMLFIARPGMARSLAADIFEHLDMHSFLPHLDRGGSRVVYSS